MILFLAYYEEFCDLYQGNGETRNDIRSLVEKLQQVSYRKTNNKVENNRRLHYDWIYLAQYFFPVASQ
jgi:hypothetical protein